MLQKNRYTVLGFSMHRSFSHTYKLFVLFLSFFINSYTIETQYTKSAVTTGYFSGKRLGDNLQTYFKAKWISYKYNLPFFYQTFSFSEQFKLHQIEQQLTSNIRINNRYKNINFGQKKIKESDCSFDKIPLALWHIGFFFLPDKVQFNEENNEFDFHQEMFFDPIFRTILKTLVAPNFPIELVPIPNNVPSVAVHVRKGGSFRDEELSLVHGKKPTKGITHIDQISPLKFPPDEYYIYQIIELSKRLGDPLLYVHIFSDTDDIETLVSTFARIVDKPNILWNYRKKNNKHYTNILEDLFSMTKFDYLIRGRSFFSEAAQILGDHMQTIYPTKHIWEVDESSGKHYLKIIEVANVTPTEYKVLKSTKT